jgi:hypothetical protein
MEMAGHVKGVLFLDYVRMIKSRRDVDWDKYLVPADREYLQGMVLPSQWYPLESYQRMGVAVLRELAGGKMEVVRLWGRLSVRPLGPNRVRVTVDVPFDDKLADEAAAYQMLGSFERVLELSGARNVRCEFVSKVWEGAASSVLELSWE